MLINQHMIDTIAKSNNEKLKVALLIGRILLWLAVVSTMSVLLPACTNKGKNTNGEQLLSSLMTTSSGTQIQGIYVGQTETELIHQIESLSNRQRSDFSRNTIDPDFVEYSWFDRLANQRIIVRLTNNNVSLVSITPTNTITIFDGTKQLGVPDAYTATWIGGERASTYSIKLIYSEEGIVLLSFVDVLTFERDDCHLDFSTEYEVDQIRLVAGGEIDFVVNQLRQPISIVGEWLLWPEPMPTQLDLLGCEQ